MLMFEQQLPFGIRILKSINIFTFSVISSQLHQEKPILSEH